MSREGRHEQARGPGSSEVCYAKLYSYSRLKKRNLDRPGLPRGCSSFLRPQYPTAGVQFRQFEHENVIGGDGHGGHALPFLSPFGLIFVSNSFVVLLNIMYYTKSYV